jgi:hypothetical protein
MGRSYVSTSVVKWIEGLSNRVSIIIRRYIARLRFAACMTVSIATFFIFFGTIMYHSIYNCMFCMLFLFCGLCIHIVVLCILTIMFMYSYCYVQVCSVKNILFHCVFLCSVGV